MQQHQQHQQQQNALAQAQSMLQQQQILQFQQQQRAQLQQQHQRQMGGGPRPQQQQVHIVNAVQRPGMAPGAAAQRPPGMQQPNNAVALAAAAVKAAELAPGLKRAKKRKLPDRGCDAVVAELPESALFTAAEDLEREIESRLHREKARVALAALGKDRPPKKLRIILQSRHFHQAAAPAGQAAAEPPSWEFEVSGRLIDASEAEGSAAAASTSAAQAPGSAGQAVAAAGKTPSPPLTSLLRRLTIRLDAEQYPAANVVVWSRNAHEGPPRDRFSVRRQGSKDVAVVVEVEPDGVPDYVTPTPKLAELLGLPEGHATRQDVMHALWRYIRTHQLQVQNQATVVQCDAALKDLLGGESMLKTSALAGRIGALLAPLPLPTLRYTVKTQGRAKRECFHFDIEAPPRGWPERVPLFERIPRDKELDAMDEKLAGLLRRLRDCMRRRDFYVAFSQSPVDFINALVASQSRDLRMAQLSESGGPGSSGGPLALRRSELFRGRWVDDAVLRYLNRRIGAGG